MTAVLPDFLNKIDPRGARPTGRKPRPHWVAPPLLIVTTSALTTIHRDLSLGAPVLRGLERRLLCLSRSADCTRPGYRKGFRAHVARSVRTAHAIDTRKFDLV